MARCEKLRLFFIPLVILSCFASLFVADGFAAADPVTDFIIKADSLARAGGNEALTPYVIDRGILVGAVVGQLLDVAFEIGQGGDKAAEVENVDFAERVAALYADNGGSQVSIDQVRVYKGWTDEQRDVRGRAKTIESEAFDARNAGEYDRAVELFGDVIELAESIGDRRTIAVTWGSLGVVHWYRGDNDAVVESYNRALEERRAIEDRILEGKTLNGLGSINFRKGEYDVAVGYFGEAADLRRDTGDFGGLGISLTYRANAFYNQSRLYDARESLNEAFAVLEAHGSPEQMIEVLNSMASIDSDMGQIDRANETYLRAIEIASTVDSPQDEASCRINLGGNYTRQGRYREALDQFDFVPALLRRQPEPEKTVHFHSARAETYKAMGDLDSARDDILAALDTSGQLEDPYYRIDTRILLGTLYIEFGAYDRALEIALEAKTISEEAGYPREYASACNLASRAEQWQGNYIAAISFRRLALEQNLVDGDELGVLQDKLGIASCRAALGQNEKAREECYSVLPGVSKSYRQELLSAVHLSIGHTFEKSNPDSAAFHYEKALSMIEESRKSVGGAETRTGYLSGERRLFFEEVARFYSSLSTGEKGDPWVARGFYTIERAKSRGLLDLMERAVLSQAAPAEEAVLDSLYAVNDDQEAVRRLETRYIELRDARVRASLGSIDPQGSVVSIDVVQKRLPKKTVMLEYALGDTVSLLWVIDKKNARVFEIPNRAALETDMVRFRDAIRRPGTGDAALKETARGLYEALVLPAEPYLEKTDRLIIVPDGFLFELPFEVLLTADAAPEAGWQDLPYVAKSFETVYAPAASIFVKLEESRKKRKKYAVELLAFGDPDYSLFDSEPGASLVPLPGSRGEVERISNPVDAKKKRVYFGAAANETQFKESIREGAPRITHLATHGLVDPVEPVSSNVVLSPDEANGEDGYLYTLEILSLPVESGVVVLSACESGTGRLGRGEGVVGLSRAFIGAGARGVVASLWPVSDESTAELMSVFYDTMIGNKKPAGRALRTARLELIQSETFAHPFYWSPFVVVGTPKIPW